MATRSNIGLLNPDGTITGIYCHWDGYPNHQMPILENHYDTLEKVITLLALGNLSFLAPEIGESNPFEDASGKYCCAYGRDRGEKGQEAKTYSGVDDRNFYFNDYSYLFIEGQGWTYTEN
jgi:hypothetical protein